MRRAVLVVLVLVAAACAGTSTAPSGPFDTRVVLAPGQSATVDEAPLVLTFIGVMGDSRCPADAVCILGGDALVRIDVTSDRSQPARYDLHTGSMQPVQHRDVTIALVELSPYPFSSRTIEPRDYRATLRVTR